MAGLATSVALTSELMVERTLYRSALEEVREIVVKIDRRGAVDPRLREDIASLKAILASAGVQVRA